MPTRTVAVGIKGRFTARAGAGRARTRPPGALAPSPLGSIKVHRTLAPAAESARSPQDMARDRKSGPPQLSSQNGRAGAVLEIQRSPLSPTLLACLHARPAPSRECDAVKPLHSAPKERRVVRGPTRQIWNGALSGPTFRAHSLQGTPQGLERSSPPFPTARAAVYGPRPKGNLSGESGYTWSAA